MDRPLIRRCRRARGLSASTACIGLACMGLALTAPASSAQMNNLYTTYVPGSVGNCVKIGTGNQAVDSGAGCGSGTGGVSSVGLALPSTFTVTGSPITTSGTLTGAYASESANTFLAAPSGSSGIPAFRALLNADLPASGVTAGSYTASSITVNAQGIVTAASSGSSGGGTTVRGALAGMILSIDTTHPTTTLDIGAGQAADSTAATYITLGSTFFKSTAGAWAAGAGSGGSPVNGMGNGLTIAASTWYHVCAIINSGSADAYFDTSATCADTPTGTTSTRRIGSFKTDASAHIIAFVQEDDTFYWSAITASDITATAVTSTPTLFALNVPTGVNVRPMFSFRATTTTAFKFSSPSEVISGTVSCTSAPGCDLNENSSNAYVASVNDRYTNTSGQIYIWSAAGTTSGDALWTRGWQDTREKQQ